MPHKKIIIFAILIAGLLATAGTIWYVRRADDRANNNQPDPAKYIDGIDYSPSTEEDNKPAEEAKQNEGTDPNKPAPEDISGTNEPEASSNNLEIVLTRTYATQGSLSLGAIVNGADSGQCEFKISDAVQTITRTAEVMSSNGSLGCGLNVDVAGLSTVADWQIHAQFVAGEQRSAATSTTLTAEERS